MDFFLFYNYTLNHLINHCDLYLFKDRGHIRMNKATTFLTYTQKRSVNLHDFCLSKDRDHKRLTIATTKKCTKTQERKLRLILTAESYHLYVTLRLKFANQTCAHFVRGAEVLLVFHLYVRTNQTISHNFVQNARMFIFISILTEDRTKNLVYVGISPIAKVYLSSKGNRSSTLNGEIVLQEAPRSQNHLDHA